MFEGVKIRLEAFWEVPIIFPPVGASYQVIMPEVTEADKLTVPPQETEAGVAVTEEGGGIEFTMIVMLTRDDEAVLELLS